MPQQIHVQERLTSRYRDGWDHLDNWQHLATLKALAPRVTSTGDGHDDAGSVVQRFVIPSEARGLNTRRIAQALTATLSGSRCRHEYDCCGCISRSARAIASSRTSISVRISLTRNY